MRCQNMSDMSFAIGVRPAVSKHFLEICYSSQTFRMVPQCDQARGRYVWPALFITVHNLSLDNRDVFIRRCVAACNLKTMVRSIQMGTEFCGDIEQMRKYCDILLLDGRLYQHLQKRFVVGSKRTPAAVHIDLHPVRQRVHMGKYSSYPCALIL